MSIEVPLQQDLADELIEFWADIYGTPLDVPREMLLGDETDHNLHTLYLARRGHKLAGTCLLTVSKAVPMLGGLGEVATASASRRTGIATELCSQAVEDFRARGGQAFFLGTVNADAARVYHRLGWRKLPGAGVMLNVTGRKSPEEFLVDYFRDIGETTVRVASPAVRVPIIPLVHTPHDWQVLDANARVFSRRYSDPGGCMSLYRKYEAVTGDGRGAWFAASDDRGRVVGLSTARLHETGGCQVDGFAHKRFMVCWEELMAAAMRWGAANGAARLQATVSVEDEEKQSLLEGLGFHKSGGGEEFEVGGRADASVRMERAAR